MPSDQFLHDLLAKFFYLGYRISTAWLTGASLAVLAHRDPNETYPRMALVNR